MPKAEEASGDKLADIYAFLDDVEAQAEQEAASLRSQAPSHSHAVYPHDSYDRQAVHQDRRHDAKDGAHQLPQEGPQQQQQQGQQQLQGLKAEAQGRAPSIELGQASAPVPSSSVLVADPGSNAPELSMSPGKWCVQAATVQQPTHYAAVVHATRALCYCHTCIQDCLCGSRGCVAEKLMAATAGW